MLLLSLRKQIHHLVPKVSLILVDADTEGFERGRNLDKIGQHSADTSELFFNDARVPMTNILGEEGMGFVYLMTQLPQERLSIAVSAMGMAQEALTGCQIRERPPCFWEDGF